MFCANLTVNRGSGRKSETLPRIEYLFHVSDHEYILFSYTPQGNSERIPGY